MSAHPHDFPDPSGLPLGPISKEPHEGDVLDNVHAFEGDIPDNFHDDEVSEAAPFTKSVAPKLQTVEEILEQAYIDVRWSWMHGKQYRLKAGKALIIIKDIWDTEEKGKFHREIEQVTFVPYTTALSYMAEYRREEKESVTESVTNEEHDDESEFEDGEAQKDTHAQTVETLQAEEEKKVEVLKKKQNRQTAITLKLTVDAITRETFVRWRDENKHSKNVCQMILRSLVLCILAKTAIGPEKVLATLNGMLDEVKANLFPERGGQHDDDDTGSDNDRDDIDAATTAKREGKKLTFLEGDPLL